MARPAANDYAAYYSNYVNKTAGETVSELIQRYSVPLADFYNSLPDEKGDHAYAPGKWTIKELLQHIIDAERIFSYRALRLARKDSTPLPGFDENSYTTHSKANQRTMASLKAELLAVRKATDLLLESFDEEQLMQRGTASDYPVTVNAIAFIIFGHLLHHQAIIEERYLKSV